MMRSSNRLARACSCSALDVEGWGFFISFFFAFCSRVVVCALFPPSPLKGAFHSSLLGRNEDERNTIES